MMMIAPNSRASREKKNWEYEGIWGEKEEGGADFGGIETFITILKIQIQTFDN